MKAPPVLALKHLSLKFSKASSAPNLVDDVSFSIERGETLCIVGESGCGKSVTSLALMGLLPSPPANRVSGEAVFDGQDLFTLSESALADLRGNRIAMVFQEPMTSLNPAYTVGEQITEVMRRHRPMSRAQADAAALQMLSRVRIPAPESRMHAYPHELSGGMRQRIMIAMALANNPSLLIADEPTTALDVTIQAQVLLLIKALQRETGTAMLLITHDLGVVAEVADTVAVMYAGRIVEYGRVADIFDDPQHPYTIGLMSAIPSIGRREAALTTIRGAVPAPEDLPEGCRFAPRCPFVEPRCVSQRPLTLPVMSRRSSDSVDGDDVDNGHTVACWRAPIESCYPDDVMEPQ